MLGNPEEVLNTMKHPENTTSAAGEIKRRFKRLNLNFGGKDRSSGKPASKEQKNSEENPSSGQPFSSFFDGKSSLFSKKPPKPETISLAGKSPPLPPLDESDWTMV